MNRTSGWFVMPRTIYAVLAIASITLLDFALPGMMYVGWLASMALGVAIAYEFGTLYARRGTIRAWRVVADRLSNGDDNPVRIELESTYRVSLHCEVLDDLPEQLQVRSLVLRGRIEPTMRTVLRYNIRPTQRGEYHFGDIHVYLSLGLGLLQRRRTIPAGNSVGVYPSYIQMRSIELASVTKASIVGQRRLRRLGHTMEFETIKHYVPGDDVRTVNWRSTARSGSMMVNLFQDEREQHIYSVIDMGRVMKMPFHGLSLLDYSINGALALSRVALLKGDRAGLVAYGSKKASSIRADRRSRQLHLLNEALYSANTDFSESNDEVMFARLQAAAPTRSLIMLYTNIETLGAFQRRLPLLRVLAARHVLVVTMFENTEVASLASEPTNSVDDLYLRNAAELLVWQKREVMHQMRKHGIYSVYAKPQDMGLAAVQQYVELKSRGSL